MSYSIFPILAIIITAIVNYDIFKLKNDEQWAKSHSAYRHFLCAVFLYYISDILWGILYEANLTLFTYIDTVVYFLAMGLSVFLFSKYVVTYLDVTGNFKKYLLFSGRLLLFLEIAAVSINFFSPILFHFSSTGEYIAGPIRLEGLIIQLFIFISTTIYIFSKTNGKSLQEVRRQYAIAFYAIVMAIAITIQTTAPLLPAYTVGFLIGISLLHTFVVEDEKDEKRKILERFIKREIKNREELKEAQHQANTDPLTGIKNKHPYIALEDEINSKIATKELVEFAVVVFDLNGLKKINDTKGHEAGDEYIKSASNLLCEYFGEENVYRIGGDEFAAILIDKNYPERNIKVKEFNKKIDENLLNGKVIIASGTSDYNPNEDNVYQDVFTRADKLMYKRKKLLKNKERKLHTKKSITSQ